MRFWITVLFLLFSFLPVESQTKRALIVGIGIYPAESGWSVIHGDNDVPLITAALFQRGFNLDKIIQLVNEKATKKNILKKFNQLIDQANLNDIVYIHFSTHGQQVIDLNGDEEDGLDEAIIPFDAYKTFVKAVYEGKNHLTDDELNKMFSALRKKNGKLGKLIVIIDACHSGDATRGNSNENDSIVIRGTSDVFQAGPLRKYTFKPLNAVNWVCD